MSKRFSQVSLSADLAALNSLTKLVRDTVQRPNATELDRSLNWLSARAAAHTSRRAQVVRWSLAGLGALLCTLVVVEVTLVWRERVRELPALSYRIEGGSVLAGGYLRDSGTGGVRLFFDEGTRVQLLSAARGSLRSSDTEGTRFELDQGSASFNVARSDVRRWWVEAGPFSVAAQGTSFTAAWDPLSERFELRIRHGSVAVSGPIAGGDIELRAGQRLLVDLPKRETLISDEQAAAATALAEARGTSSSSALTTAIHRTARATTSEP